MSFIDPKLKEDIITHIYNLKDNEYSLKQIQKSIYNCYDAILSLKTISIYQDQAFKDEWLEELERQNKKMEKWLRETEPRKFINDTEKMAEGIYNAVKNNDNSFFERFK